MMAEYKTQKIMHLDCVKEVSQHNSEKLHWNESKQRFH